MFGDSISFEGRVLVAEDDKVNQKVIRSILNKAGIDVVIKDDGCKAVEEAANGKYDLILMDINMPNMNGYDATRAIREKGNDTPIIALTASVMKDDADKCIAAGCNAFLPKPIDREKFFDMLNTYLTKNDTSLAQKLAETNGQVERINEDILESTAGMLKEKEDGDIPIALDELKDAIPYEDLMGLIDIFLTDNSRRIEQIADLIEKYDAEEIRLLAHAIKGSSASIAAMPLSAAAGKLETAAMESDVENMTSLHKDIASKFETLRDYLGNLDITKVSG
jgi:CheY-like chemotaxis protein/HPt (histidine-containing phosphotransfer) domain-containing protein